MRPTKGRTLTTAQRKFSTAPNAYRSGLEEKIAAVLERLGVTFQFEKLKLRYTVPAKEHVYTPDFQLSNGVIIETKGLFQTADRQKMLLVKAQHPDRDIRILFQNAHAKIAKGSKTTYAMWADKAGFKWAHKEIPGDWLVGL